MVLVDKNSQELLKFSPECLNMGMYLWLAGRGRRDCEGRLGGGLGDFIKCAELVNI